MMLLKLFIFLFISTSLQAQETNVDSIIKEYETPFKPATIFLFKNNSRIDSSVARYGDVIYKGFGEGDYLVVFNAIGHSSARTESINVKRGQFLKIHIKLNGPCIYNYPEAYVPECPKKHSDNIVPIVYGLVVLKKEYKDSVYLGGCTVSECDPKYYCKTHKIMF